MLELIFAVVGGVLVVSFYGFVDFVIAKRKGISVAELLYKEEG